jgi:hypothetical protein
MYRLSYFERILESATLIARHPDCPMKRRVLEQCRGEVAEMVRAGRISPEQAEEILEILGGCRLASRAS